MLRNLLIFVSTAALASALSPRSALDNTSVVRSKGRYNNIQRPIVSPLGMNNNGNDDGDDELDLFDYFDPLLSPHAYPNGISPNNKAPKKPPALEEIKPRDNGSSAFGFRLEDAVVPPPKKNINPQTTKDQPASDVFDPLLSPHAYPTGTPDKVIDIEDFIARAEGAVAPAPVAPPSRVGILFIDHGSRNGDSNRRLHEIAALYQEQFYKNEPNIFVRAAHMEIAQPSIPEALQSMMEEANGQLDEIICHPFFLSPLGRHVSEDIPEIIEGFKKESSIDIPIVTTEPVGAEISIMMQAVHSLVRQSTSKLR